MGRKSKVTISNKRRSRVTQLGAKVTLEKVLGLTSQNDSSLSCCPSSGCVAYAAGCIIVIFNPRKNKQEYISNVSRKTITALAFSQDGKHLVSGECGHNPAVRVWDVQEKTELCQFTGHKFGISCVAFFPERGYVVSVGEEHDMVINVWDWKSGGGRVSSGKIATMVSDMAFSEDGNTFVTVGNRSVKFWYFSGKSKTRQTLPLHGRNSILGEQKNNFFCSITFGRGNSSDRVYAITKSGLLCEFNEDRMLDKWVELRTRQAYCITSSDDYLFVGCADGVMRIFSAATLHFVTSLPKPHHLRIDVAAGIDKDHIFSPKENVRYPDTVAATLDNLNMKLTCIYGDHSLYVWDVHDVYKIGKQWSFLYHSSYIWGIDVYPEVTDGNKVSLPPNTFSTCSSDNTVRIWNIDPLMDTTIFSKNIYSPELLKVLYMKEDEEADDESTGEGVRSICFSPDGQLLASGDRSGNIRINDLLQANMTELHKIEAHDSEVLCLEFSQPHTGYNLLASASRDRFIHIFDMNKNCSLLQTIDDHSGSITAVKFSECNGRFQMISCGADKALLFRIATLNPDLQFSLLHHVGSKTTLYDMAIDVSKKYVATACQDRNLRIHNISSGKLKQTYKGSQSEDGTLIKVELDPSGMYAATSCSDKTLAIFDFYSGACMATMMGHSELVTGLKFTNDCRQLISVSGDGCIFVWKLPFEMTNNMKDRISERNTRLKVAAQMNQVRRETFIIPPEPPPIHINNEPATTTERDGPEVQHARDGATEEPDYRFSMGQLPLWAQKKVTGEDLPSPDKYSNPVQPRGKWGQNLGSEGFSMMFKNTAIPVRLQDGVDRRRYTLEPEAMSDDDEDDDDDFEFAPAEERLNMLEEEMENKESPPDSPKGNVRKSRGSDAAIFERQSSAVDEDVDGDEKNREEEEEEKQEDDVQEVILYPEGDTSADECLDFQVTAATLSVEELARKKHKRTNSRDLPTADLEGSKGTSEPSEGLISAEQSDEEDDDDVDSTPDVTPLSSPNRKTRHSPTTPEDEEKFLHANFTFVEKEKFDQCLEQLKDIKRNGEDETVPDRRLSISSKFLQRSRTDPSFKSRSSGSQVLQELLKKRQEDTRRAVEAMRKRLETCSITSIPEVKTPPTTPSGETKLFPSNTSTIPPNLSIVTDVHPDAPSSSNLMSGKEKDTKSANDVNKTDEAASKPDAEEKGDCDRKTFSDSVHINKVNAEVSFKVTEECKETVDKVEGRQLSGMDRPTDLKLSEVIRSNIVSVTKDQVFTSDTKTKQQGEDNQLNQDQKATDLLLIKTKSKEVGSGETSSDRVVTKDDFQRDGREVKSVKGSSSSKRSSSLSRLPQPETSSETDNPPSRSRIRSQSIERQSNPPNASARQKHRARADRNSSPLPRSYEASTQSAQAKIKKKVASDSAVPRIKPKKRNSSSFSGPVKATEDAIKPSADNRESRERSKDIKSDETKSEGEAASKQMTGEISITEKSTDTAMRSENHIAPSGELRTPDTSSARRDNSSNSLMTALEESINVVKENFSQSLATLTELKESGNTEDFNKGLESLSLTFTSMGASLEGLKKMQTSSPIRLNGDVHEVRHQRMKSCLSTFLHPRGTNGITSDGDHAAQAAINLLDQYSSMLVTLVQTKLEAENIPENEEVADEMIEC